MDLKWMRLITGAVIPEYLVEQIKERSYEVDAFYAYQEQACLTDDAESVFNPFNHLYALLAPREQIKGFLWFTIEPMTKDIWIQSFSIDSSLWNKGLAIKLVKDLVLEIRDRAELNKVYWLTRHPKYHEKHGFSRSKTVLMELDNGQDIHRVNEGKERRATDSRAEELSEQCIES